jgi:hypothetical protein
MVMEMVMVMVMEMEMVMAMEMVMEMVMDWFYLLILSALQQHLPLSCLRDHS